MDRDKKIHIAAGAAIAAVVFTALSVIGPLPFGNVSGEPPFLTMMAVMAVAAGREKWLNKRDGRPFSYADIFATLFGGMAATAVGSAAVYYLA
jgi:hypothetical protein